MRPTGFKFLVLSVLHVLVAGSYSGRTLESWQEIAGQVRRSPDLSKCYSNVTISSQSDIDAFSNCTTFAYSLTILGPDTVNLSNLTVLRGNLIFNSSSKVVNFAADSLSLIVGNGYSYGVNVDSPPMLQTLSLKSLANITGQLYIVNSSSLTNLDMPALTDVSKRIVIAQTGLQNLELPVFQQTGYPSSSSYTPTYYWGIYNPLGYLEGVSISFNPALARLWLPGITTLRTWFKVADNPNLKNFTVPNIAGIAWSSSVELNGTFEHINFPSMLSCNGTFQIKTSYKKFSCSDFGPFPKACTANSPFGSLSWDSTSKYGYSTNGNNYSGNDMGIPVFTQGQIIGCIIGSLIGFFLSILGCYCCCCHRCCTERRRKRRLKLATGTEFGPSIGATTVDQMNPPGYELRDARLGHRQRVAVDDALDVQTNTRTSTSTSPPGYGECTHPVTGSRRPPPYHPAA